MYQFKGLEDTIAAIATPSGAGGVGIIRLSGKEAVVIADKVFVAKSQKRISDCTTFTIHYGWIKDGKEIIDEVLLSVMLAPKSYTTDDVIEIHSHGSQVSLKAILELVIRQGARLAEPGEFTKRAFLNGRIDLTQAEAVLDIINSKTDTFLRVSSNQLKGELSTELENMRLQLLNIYTEIEAIVNFPEDEIDANEKTKITENIKSVKESIVELLKSSEQGRILKDGIKIVLCGKPNVGKSSLLNIFLKTERAIVSDIEGTTRDTIEESAQINGVPFQIVDTAGILNPRDAIEEEAIKRSQLNMRAADLVLLVVDGSKPLTEEDLNLMEKIREQNVFVIINKSDLPAQLDQKIFQEKLPKAESFTVSALNQDGIKQLQDAIVANVCQDTTIDGHGVMISNMRHVRSLEEARDALGHGVKVIAENISLEFVSEDIKQAVNCLDNITGRNIDNDLLDTIFSQFCIGK